MTLRYCLIALTLISVVCDTLLLPFYPQFFAQEYQQTSPEHVGWFVAACCATVMLSFPLWAKLARRVSELHIWVVTQVIAAVFGVLCFSAQTLWQFWLFAQLMLAFKASYLLIYPYVLRLEARHTHLGLVGLFSVLMHFGAIGGALIGGVLFTQFSPRYAFLISAAGDLVQVALCLWLIGYTQAPYRQTSLSSDTPRARIPAFIWRFALVSMVVYFSAFLARPFFATHWLSIDPAASELGAGVIYAIPAGMALLMLVFNHYRRGIPLATWERQRTFAASLGAAAVGLWLQGFFSPELVIAGRLLLGIAMFQVTVLLEVMLFARSEPAFYASDFAKVHLFQNIGIIGASFAAGSLVSYAGTTATFQAAALGFLIIFILFTGWLLLARQQNSAARSANTLKAQ